MVRASVLASSVSWVRIPPEQLFFLFGEKRFFSEKKELFGLVAFPFFLFIEKSFHGNHLLSGLHIIIIYNIQS